MLVVCSRGAWNCLVQAAKGTPKSAASKPAAAYFLKNGTFVYKCGQCLACQNPDTMKSKCRDKAGKSAALEKAQRDAEHAERAGKKTKSGTKVSAAAHYGNKRKAETPLVDYDDTDEEHADADKQRKAASKARKALRQSE